MPSQRRWDLDTRLRAVAGARTVDAMALLRTGGEASQAQVEAAARIERAVGRARALHAALSRYRIRRSRRLTRSNFVPHPSHSGLRRSAL